MAPPCFITVLGTVSAVPTQSRNHSSLAFSIPSGDTWLFDCGEATQLQIQKCGGGVKLGRLNRIFITHMHGDHIFGLPALMATRMNGAGGSEDDPRIQDGPIPSGTRPTVELYGPTGLRRYLRETFRLTYTRLDGYYVVHELHPPPQTTTTSSSSSTSPLSGLLHSFSTPHGADEGVPYEKELPGRDIFPDADGIWRDITQSSSSSNPATVASKNKAERDWTINAGPILHTVPCMGFVLEEPALPGTIPPSYRQRLLDNKSAFAEKGIKNPLVLLSKLTSEDGIIDLPDGTKLTKPPTKPGRKIVILGDTSDPSPITHAAMGADVLIHEATNAYLIKQDGISNTQEDYESLEAWTMSRGHSTPEMAGRFARRIRLGSNGRAFTSVLLPSKDDGKKRAEESEGKGSLLLNHFSSRYADPRISEQAAAIMEEIRCCGVNGYKEKPSRDVESLADKVANAELTEEEAVKQGTAASQYEEEEDIKDIDVICTHDCMRLEIRAIK